MDIRAELQTALESLVVAFKEMCARPKVTYSLDGQNASWIEFFTMLRDGIKELTGLLAMFDPQEIRTNIL